MITLGGRVGHDNLHAGVRSVVGSLSLLPVAVSHIVGILLLKLTHRDRERERERDRERERGGGEHTTVSKIPE